MGLVWSAFEKEPVFIFMHQIHCSHSLLLTWKGRDITKSDACTPNTPNTAQDACRVHPAWMFQTNRPRLCHEVVHPKIHLLLLPVRRAIFLLFWISIENVTGRNSYRWFTEPRSSVAGRRPADNILTSFTPGPIFPSSLSGDTSVDYLKLLLDDNIAKRLVEHTNSCIRILREHAKQHLKATFKETWEEENLTLIQRFLNFFISRTPQVICLFFADPWILYTTNKQQTAYTWTKCTSLLFRLLSPK